MSEQKFHFHKGYFLRSHTELVWVQILEAAGIMYLYEPDLIEIEGGYYLPDFWLPHAGIYLEVKGKAPTQEEIRKAESVTERTGRDVYFLIGKPESDRHGLYNCGLMALGASGWHHNLSPNDLHCMVRDFLGNYLFNLIGIAANRRDENIPIPASIMLEVLFLSGSDRSGLEKYLRAASAKANAAKLLLGPDPGECDLAIKSFLDRQRNNVRIPTIQSSGTEPGKEGGE